MTDTEILECEIENPEMQGEIVRRISCSKIVSLTPNSRGYNTYIVPLVDKIK
jgi:hypothetical protein